MGLRPTDRSRQITLHACPEPARLENPRSGDLRDVFIELLSSLYRLVWRGSGKVEGYNEGFRTDDNYVFSSWKLISL